MAAQELQIKPVEKSIRLRCVMPEGWIEEHYAFGVTQRSSRQGPGCTTNVDIVRGSNNKIEGVKSRLFTKSIFQIHLHKKRRVGSTALLVFCSLVLVFLSGAEVQAQTNTASAGTTWAAATWSLGHVPTNADDAVINSGVNLTIGTAAVCASLTIGNATATATTLTVGAGGSLSVTTAGGGTGNLTINPSNVTVDMTLAVGAQSATIDGTVTISLDQYPDHQRFNRIDFIHPGRRDYLVRRNADAQQHGNRHLYGAPDAERRDDSEHDDRRNVRLQWRLHQIRRDVYHNGRRNHKIRRQLDGQQYSSHIERHQPGAV